MPKSIPLAATPSSGRAVAVKMDGGDFGGDGDGDGVAFSSAG
jgi:hypothetical protein